MWHAHVNTAQENTHVNNVESPTAAHIYQEVSSGLPSCPQTNEALCTCHTQCIGSPITELASHGPLCSDWTTWWPDTVWWPAATIEVTATSLLVHTQATILRMLYIKLLWLNIVITVVPVCPSLSQSVQHGVWEWGHSDSHWGQILWNYYCCLHLHRPHLPPNKPL